MCFCKSYFHATDFISFSPPPHLEKILATVFHDILLNYKGDVLHFSVFIVVLWALLFCIQ